MKKIKLEIVGLSYSQTQASAYALVLGENNRRRRLPIIIGAFEAQAIAIELEKMTPARPLTHDLFKNFALAYGIEVQEVIIYNLVEGIFFSKLICNDGNKSLEIDARTSDAIAIAVRFNCPIYTYEFILSTAGIILEDKLPLEHETESKAEQKSSSSSDTGLTKLSMEELKTLLKKNIEEEHYEQASKIRDEINRRKQAQ